MLLQYTNLQTFLDFFNLPRKIFTYVIQKKILKTNESYRYYEKEKIKLKQKISH